jgi:Ser/Thr protein kinase RdoA (MazF antagonist)
MSELGNPCEGRPLAAPESLAAAEGWRVPPETREEVVCAFARLQIEAVPHVRRLLRAGCLDRRLGWLAGQASGWLPAIEEIGRLPGIDRATWLDGAELAELRAAAPRLTAMCAELAAFRVPASLVHGDLHLGNVAGGPGGYRFFDWTDACVAHPFVDLLTFLHDDEDDADDALRARVRDAYLAEWTRFEPADRLRRAWRLAAPLGALHHALSYRSIVANLTPPVEEHLARSTASWLRRLLAELRPATGDRPELAGRLRTTRPRC